MKTIFTCLILVLLLPIMTSAQTKQKAEKEFVNELNSILKNSPSQHWGYEGSMSIDSAFAISPAGILSVTVRYKTDTSFVRARMQAPVSKIINVAYDLYLILAYKTEEVTIYNSEEQSEELKEIGKSIYFHIGEPVGDGFKEKEKLQKLLDKLLKYYPN